MFLDPIYETINKLSSLNTLLEDQAILFAATVDLICFETRNCGKDFLAKLSDFFYRNSHSPPFKDCKDDKLSYFMG